MLQQHVLIKLRIGERRRPIIRVVRFGNCLVRIEDELETHTGPALEGHLAWDIGGGAGL